MKHEIIVQQKMKPFGKKKNIRLKKKCFYYLLSGFYKDVLVLLSREASK